MAWDFLRRQGRESRNSPFRSRRNALSYLTALLDQCAFRARTLAGSAEPVAAAGSQEFRDQVRRVQGNLDRLIAGVADRELPERLAEGSGLGQDRTIEVGGAAGRRLLAYFDRLDGAVLALARPLGTIWGSGVAGAGAGRTVQKVCQSVH